MVTRKRCRMCQAENREELEASLESGQISADALDKKMDWPSGTTSRRMRNHMGEYYNNSNPRCVLCTDPLRDKYEEALHEGKLSITNVAEVLGTTKDQIARHMKHHLQPLVQQSAANIIAKKEVDEIEILEANILRLESKVDELFGQDELNGKYIEALTRLAKEIRESLRYLLEFKGKLVHKRQDTIIVAQMQIVQEVLAQQHPQVWLDVKAKMQERLQ